MRAMTSSNAHISGPPTDLAGAILTVDLDAIQENWKRLAAKAAPAECGAAVKGNAYGLGVEHGGARLCGRPGAAPSSWRGPWKAANCAASCRARRSSMCSTDCFPARPNSMPREDLRPALITIEEAREWAAFGTVYGRNLPCAIHVDTGINRLGFSAAAFDALIGDNEIMARPQPHFADEPSRLRR